MRYHKIFIVLLILSFVSLIITGCGTSDYKTIYAIFGKISNTSGKGISSVIVTIKGAASFTATTDANGNYTFIGLQNGNYTVTPSKTGFSFTPTNKAVTISNAGKSDINFIGGTDITPPTPDPMTWKTPPHADSSNSISMEATTATDSESPPVFYYFDFVDSQTGGTGGSDSSWQLSTSYTDTGLQPNNQYGYRVQARDSASPPNPTEYSSTIPVYTLANPPGTAAFSDVTRKCIRANWTANGNPNGTKYLCKNITTGAESGWTTNLYWENCGLSCDTNYTFQVQAKNGDETVTTPTNLGTQSTLPCDITPPDVGVVTPGPSNKVTATHVDGTFDLTANVTEANTVSSCEYCALTTTPCNLWNAGTVGGAAPNWTCTATGITGFANGDTVHLNISATDDSNNTGIGGEISRFVDSQAPTTTASATACGSSYTFNTWTKCSPVSVTLSASDGAGSGVASGYPKYCTDSDNSCNPNTPFESPIPITCPSDSTCPNQYIRYYSVDNVSKTESEKSSNVKQDRQRPTDGTLNAEPGDKKVDLNWSGFSDNGGSGIKNYKLVYKIGIPPPDSGCSSGTEIYSGTGTLYTHNGTLTNVTTYCYRVCAIDNVGNPYSDGATDCATPGCSYSISPTDQSFPSSGGNGSFNITAPNGCPWTAVSNNPDCLTITSGSSGTGDGTVNYSVSVNTNQSSRQCTMTIAEKKFTVNQAGTDIYFYDFEQGIGSWWVDNGVWEVGTPTSGPNGCYSGTQCAATVLTGDYPPDTDSRLISPSVQLPDVTLNEEIHLRFRHWFSYARSDNGSVQISVYDSATGNWSDWVNIGNIISDISGGWSLRDVDLTGYASKKIRIAFYHTASSWPWGECSSGWYVDDVLIIKKIPEFTGDFESGWRDWWVDNGVWEVGTPTSGPNGCYSGTQCAATVLTGDYPPDTDSRLISPSVQLPDVTLNEEIHLRFRHWFSYARSDNGSVQISVYDSATGNWSDWVNIGNIISDISGGWSLRDVDLTGYASKKIRIAFYHTADSWPWGECSSGWYVDDVLIEKVAVGGASMSLFKAILEDIITAHNTETSSNKAQDGSKGGFCFIATAAYGSYLDPHVQVLREFRDKYLV